MHSIDMHRKFTRRKKITTNIDNIIDLGGNLKRATPFEIELFDRIIRNQNIIAMVIASSFSGVLEKIGSGGFKGFLFRLAHGGNETEHAREKRLSEGEDIVGVRLTENAKLLLEEETGGKTMGGFIRGNASGAVDGGVDGELDGRQSKVPFGLDRELSTDLLLDDQIDAFNCAMGFWVIGSSDSVFGIQELAGCSENTGLKVLSAIGDNGVGYGMSSEPVIEESSENGLGGQVGKRSKFKPTGKSVNHNQNVLVTSGGSKWANAVKHDHLKRKIGGS